jgi:hypothetical protein
MKHLNRHVILLLDNATVHKIIPENEPTNITVKFLPPNTTSILQPADAGIIHSFKAQYRKLFIQHQLQLFDDIMESNEQNGIGKYNIKHAIYNVSNAWNNVSMETIQNCWRKAGILPMPSPECFFDFSSIDNDNTQIDEFAQTSFDEIISQASEKIEEEANNQRILIQDLINQLHLPDSLSADGK